MGRGVSWLFIAVAGLALAGPGCGGSELGNPSDGGFGDDASGDTDSDTDGDTDSDTGSDTDGGADGGEDGGEDGSAEAGTDTGTEKDPAAAFEGLWASLVNVTIVQMGIPLLNTQWVASRNWYLVEMMSDGHGHVTAREKLCSIKLKLETWLNKSIVPKSFIDHVNAIERHVTVASDAPGSPWVSDTVYEVRGANLCNGECNPKTDSTCDKLPGIGSSKPNDSTPCSGACNGKSCDQDDDGHAGMTNVLSGVLNCEIYSTQRWWAKLNGAVVDADTIAGPITDNFSEQTVVAASDAVCGASSPGTVSENCPKHQYFKMVRLPDGATCKDVMALTDCDENEEACDSNAVKPLDPKNDKPNCG
ncbi:MAG: hypothetical protein PHU25_09100 [Deltaproteobacteria bacterium]|nr:hypothetical protein [Deltaproteobacteria bacterium]